MKKLLLMLFSMLILTGVIQNRLKIRKIIRILKLQLKLLRQLLRLLENQGRIGNMILKFLITV